MSAYILIHSRIFYLAKYVNCKLVNTERPHNSRHGSAMEGYYPHESILGYEMCQIKGTLIEVSELTLEQSKI